MSDSTTGYGSTPFTLLSRGQNLRPFILKLIETALANLSQLLTTGSGLDISKLLNMELKIVVQKSLRVGRNFVNAPQWLHKHLRKRSLVDPTGFLPNNYCLIQCMLYLICASNKDTVRKSDMVRLFNQLQELRPNMPLSALKTFIYTNQAIFGSYIVVIVRADGNNLLPVVRAGFPGKNKKILHVLIFRPLPNDVSSTITLGNVFHALAITDFQRFVRHFVQTSTRSTILVCGLCLIPVSQHFSLFWKHMASCQKALKRDFDIPDCTGPALSFPPKEKCFKEFKKFVNRFPAPYIGAWDAECYVQPTIVCAKCNRVTIDDICPQGCTFGVTKINKHNIYSCCLVIYNREEQKIVYFKYFFDDTGTACVQMLNFLKQNDHEIVNSLQRFPKLQKHHYCEAKQLPPPTTCYICEEPFKTEVINTAADVYDGMTEKPKIALDHCHLVSTLCMYTTIC